MLDDRTLQVKLRKLGAYNDAPIDGHVGPRTRAAIELLLRERGVNYAGWSAQRQRIGAEQILLSVTPVDGFIGPVTQEAYEAYVRAARDTEHLSDTCKPATKNDWPAQRDVPAYYGSVGQNQVMLELPYPLRIAWDRNTSVTRMSLHKLVAPSAGVVLRRVLDHYGYEAIQRLDLDLWGGSLNVRRMRGGTAMSMHSWGIAIDWDPTNNELYWGRDRARLALPGYDAFWEAWEAEGWVSLGRTKNYDWMHVQAARL